jgi:hypothetical protein
MQKAVRENKNIIQKKFINGREALSFFDKPTSK